MENHQKHNISNEILHYIVIIIFISQDNNKILNTNMKIFQNIFSLFLLIPYEILMRSDVLKDEIFKEKIPYLDEILIN